MLDMIFLFLYLPKVVLSLWSLKMILIFFECLVNTLKHHHATNIDIIFNFELDSQKLLFFNFCLVFNDVLFV